MSAFVTGATGLIGRHLLERLGEDVVVTSRNPEKARGSIKHGRVIGWDGTSALAQGALDGVDAVFHLAGEPVAEGRWTDEKKKRIEESRVLSTRSIVDAMKAMTTRPKVFVCGSAVGIYGSRGDEVLTEESAPGDTFLARVCVDWEREAEKAEELGVRVVRVRQRRVRGGGARCNFPAAQVEHVGTSARSICEAPDLQTVGRDQPLASHALEELSSVL